jgi:hypothetical protein
MKNDIIFHDLRPILLAQNKIIDDINNSLNKIETPLSTVYTDKEEIAELQIVMKELEENKELLDYKIIEDWDESKIETIYTERKYKYQNEFDKLNFENWDNFILQSEVYCVKNNLSMLMPWEAMLSKEDFVTLSKEDYNQQYKWDKWDYIFVGAAGVIASLTDYFLVKIPQTMKYNGSIQEGSPITEFLKKNINSENANSSSFSNFANDLQNKCKVPYDTMDFEGAYPKTHRLQTLGHDPILGFIFGVSDIMSGKASGFSYYNNIHTFQKLSVYDNTSVNIISALMTHMGHLISDVGTKMGLPPPFFSLFQTINMKNPFSAKSRSFAEIARWMYLNGYDLRHFITMSITPAVIEIILRMYIMIRHYVEKGETKINLASNPKYRSMLLTAHSIACAGNVGKVALMEGNPLAINYSEWLAFVRYLVPSLKYWLFDKSKLKLEYYKKINDDNWNLLLEKSDLLLENIYKDQIKEPIILS